MSLLARYECPTCFGYVDYPGLRARRDPLRKHLACTCPKGGCAMKPLPSDPFALQARMMDALIGDILDPNATTFKRLDAMREISRQSRETAEQAVNHNGK